MTKDIMQFIRDEYDSLSKGHKKIASFILEQSEEAVFMTALEIGERLGVSESTVVRFASKLGLQGYPDLQAKLQMWMKEVIKQSNQFTLSKEVNKQTIMQLLQADIDSISATLSEVSEQSFETAIQTILNAKHVYILGVRNSYPLASFLCFHLSLLRREVVLIDKSSSTEILEQLIHIDEEDVVIGISFPRYSLRTVKAMEFANDRGAKLISVTDDVFSPLNLYASIKLIAKSHFNGVTDSLVAAFSLLNVLVVSLYAKQPEKIVKTIKDLEEVWDTYQVHEHDEINMIGEEMAQFLEKESE